MKIFKICISILRLNTPIGIWLLFIPCLWGLLLVKTLKHYPSKEFILLFLGSILMRSFGCLHNDIFDKKIDKHVKRTSRRFIIVNNFPLFEISVILIIILLLSSTILLKFSFNFFIFALIIILALFIYPFIKRIFKFPQIFLGFLFNVGVFWGWFFVENTFSYNLIITYIFGIIWTIFYDTLYAFQDLRYDISIGINSIAVQFYQNIEIILLFLIVLLSLILFLFCKATNFILVFFYLIFLTSLYIQVIILNFVKILHKRFNFNFWIGLIITICYIIK